MPQPKKPGSPAPKPSARKPAPRKPAARKAAAPPRKGRPGTRPGQAGAGRPSDAGAAAANERREEQLHAAAASLRELLSRGAVITADRLQDTVEEAVRLGRMTREDAEELARNLLEIGRRQTQDTLAEVEALLGRSAKETRRQMRARLKDVSATAARHAPGADRALRTVDRVRRAAGLGGLPIAGYEELTTAQVKERLAGLDEAQLRRVRDHERRNANRKSVLAAIDARLA
jgi:hypothetical protein